MPAFATHYLFMKEMLPFIRENSDFRFNSSAAAIGTQGPDIFFFGSVFSLPTHGVIMSKVGSAMHRAKPAEIFEAFRDYCTFSPNIDVAKSYIYGFILHYALDRNCHPYVYSYQERILARNHKLHKSSAHNRVEMAMDTRFLYEKAGYKNPADFDGSTTITSDYEVIEEVSHLLSFVIPRVTQYAMTEEEVASAIRATKKFQRIIKDKSGALRNLCRATETVFAPIIKHYKFSSAIRPKDLEKSKKYGNINNGTWYSPYEPDRERNESFLDLFNISIADAENLILGFRDMLRGRTNGREVTHNISFLTGIEA